MKRIGKLIAVVMLLTLLSMACSHYVCPAYSSDTTTEQQDGEHS